MQKPQISSNIAFLYIETLSLFRFSLSSLACHNTALVLCLGLGTKTIWLGLGKHHGFAWIICFVCHRNGRRWPQRLGCNLVACWHYLLCHLMMVKSASNLKMWTWYATSVQPWMCLWFAETLTPNMTSCWLDWVYLQKSMMLQSIIKSYLYCFEYMSKRISKWSHCLSYLSYTAPPSCFESGLNVKTF